MIHNWRESKKTPTQKLKDELERLTKWVDDIPGNSTDELSFHDGFTGCKPDPDRRTPNLKAIGIISLSTFKTFAGKLQKCTHALASSSKDSKAIKKIDDVFKQNFSKKDLIYDGKTPVAFMYPTTSCTFPNGEWYKNFTKCADEMSNVMSKFKDDLRGMIKACDDILEEETDGVDKSELLDRVAFIKTALIYNDLIRSIHDSWEDNIRRLCQIDIVWED